jgi:hypothetical protein
LATALITCVAVTAPAHAQVDAAGRDVGFEEITPDARDGIDRGLRYLADSQADDGSWGGGRYGRHVGITAMACMAFLADGHTPGRGPYGEHVQRGLDFILNHVTESDLIAAETSHGPMYGHGFATLLLGEVYGMTGEARVREALLKAVRLIINTQNHEGGWRYHPVPFEADISVTICQVMALRSARNAGIAVPRETIDRAVQYVRNCQNPADGGFRYMLGAGGSAYPRSAAGVATLFYAGVYEGDAVQRGLRYVLDESANADRSGHYYYGHYYAAQAMYQAGGEYWAQWFPTTRDELLDNQRDNGSWTSGHGDDYATATALLTLLIPNRLLPIFQR